MKLSLRIAVILLCLLGLASCKVSYSFTGADVPADAKTFSVELFRVSAALANPSYAQKLTERLKDQVQNQTRLVLSPQSGDLRFSGTITRYDVSPMAIQGNERAGVNRFTVSVKLAYVNSLDEQKNFEREFSQFVDFDAGKNLSDVENSLIDEINDKLVQDMFNASLGNW